MTAHPDTQRPFGCRPVVAQLVSTLADKHRLLVHSVLTSRAPRAVYARANLAHMLAERGWHLGAIDMWFGWASGEAAAGVKRWTEKLTDDEARRIERLNGLTEEEYLDKLAKDGERSKNSHRKAKAREAARAKSPTGSAVSVVRAKVVEAPKPRRHSAKPLTASLLESSLMSHGIASGCTAKSGGRNGRQCGRQISGADGLCLWHASLKRREAETEERKVAE